MVYWGKIRVDKAKQINTHGSRRRAHHFSRLHQLFFLFKKKIQKLNLTTNSKKKFKTNFKLKKENLFILRILCECL